MCDFIQNIAYSDAILRFQLIAIVKLTALCSSLFHSTISDVGADIFEIDFGALHDDEFFNQNAEFLVGVIDL